MALASAMGFTGRDDPVPTTDGYIVDVIRGATCIQKEIHMTREQAVRRALALENQHRRATTEAVRKRRAPPEHPKPGAARHMSVPKRRR